MGSLADVHESGKDSPKRVPDVVPGDRNFKEVSGRTLESRVRAGRWWTRIPGFAGPCARLRSGSTADLLIRRHSSRPQGSPHSCRHKLAQ